MFKKRLWPLSAVAGIISGLLGAIGALGFCSAAWIVTLFALLGLNSMILMTYSKWFLLAGFIFLSLAVFTYFKLGKNACPKPTKSSPKWFFEMTSIWILIIVASLLAYSNFRNFSFSGGAKKNQGDEVEAYLKFKQIKASAIPSGIPEVYGQELNISFDEVQKAIDTVAPFGPTYGTEEKKIILAGEDLERYKKIGSLIACEYCCGATTLVFENGEAACGCAHSQMMRGLTAWLITNHPREFTDEQILEELKNWKAVFFPKETLVAKIVEMEKSGEPGVKELLEEFPDFLPQMVGGC